MTIAIAASVLAAPCRAAEGPVCAVRSFEGQSFTACLADLARHDVRLFLKDPGGAIYGRPEALPQTKLLFSTNAGMFNPEHLPAGLYVEASLQIKALNTKPGGGNFHLMPNGVFWIKDGAAHVATTAEFAARKVSPEIATQSGPMLVIDGTLHPKFDENGRSRTIRNGVGIVDATHIAFAISNEAVSFGVFARLFRDDLKCQNALYLDGAVSRLYVPGQSDGYGGGRLGPLFGVYTRR